MVLSPQALVVAALLIHQISRLVSQQRPRPQDTFAPVTGVRLPVVLNVTGQLVALPIAVALAVLDNSFTVRLGVAALVIWWLMSIQGRLSNHVLLGTVVTLLLVAVPTDVADVLARDVLAGVYLSAGLFKLNKEYMFSERSAGRVLAVRYLERLGLPVPATPVLVVASTTVVVGEIGAGVLLLLPGGAFAALLAAVALHLSFGVSGNFEFSIVAMALWCLALQPTSLLPDGIGWGVVALSAALGILLSRRPSGARRFRHLGLDGLLGAAYGFLCIAALSAVASLPSPSGPGWLHLLVAALFTANLVAVVVGLKLEWSFAMFSSLRPFGRAWMQRGVVGDPRYFQLTLPASIPVPLLNEVKGQFLRQATRADTAVYEGVAFHLETIARKYGRTFAPRLLLRDCGNGQLRRAEASSQPSPRRRPMAFPATVPVNLELPYLG